MKIESRGVVMTINNAEGLMKGFGNKRTAELGCSYLKKLTRES